MSINYNHPFHLVNPSPWPLLGSLRTRYLLLGIVWWFKNNSLNYLILIGFLITIIIIYQWWRDIIRESTFQGFHTYKVIINIKWGIIIFITSEILFFFSFFWAFFHRRLSPDWQLGLQWPPSNILIFNPFKIPLLNTIILLTSGISVTWSHHALLNNNLKSAINRLIFTIILGIYFTILQSIEYSEATFSINDRVYGTTFFVTTGFHGLHVIIGTTFLLICLIRIIHNHFSNYHNFGYEAAIWYWHFVDVVWIFLFTFIYWWPY